MVMVLTLSGCFGMHADIQKVERLLQEKYGMAFRGTKYQSRWFTGTGDYVTVYATPVDYPDLEFSATLHDSGELEEDFLDYYGEYHVVQFFQRLADEVRFDAVFQGIGTYAGESWKPIEIALPLDTIDPVHVIQNNTHRLYVIYIFVQVEQDTDQQALLAKFHQFLELYKNRYPELPEVLFRVAVGNKQQVDDAAKLSLHHDAYSEYEHVFRRKLLTFSCTQGVLDVTTEELSQYFLTELPTP